MLTQTPPRISLFWNKILPGLLLLLVSILAINIGVYANQSVENKQYDSYRILTIVGHSLNVIVLFMIAFTNHAPVINLEIPQGWPCIIGVLNALSFCFGGVTLINVGIVGPSENTLVFITCLQWLALFSFMGIGLIIVFIHNCCMCKKKETIQPS